MIAANVFSLIANSQSLVMSLILSVSLFVLCIVVMSCAYRQMIDFSLPTEGDKSVELKGDLIKKLLRKLNADYIRPIGICWYKIVFWPLAIVVLLLILACIGFPLFLFAGYHQIASKLFSGIKLGCPIAMGYLALQVIVFNTANAFSRRSKERRGKPVKRFISLVCNRSVWYWIVFVANIVIHIIWYSGLVSVITPVVIAAICLWVDNIHTDSPKREKVRIFVLFDLLFLSLLVAIAAYYLS